MSLRLVDTKTLLELAEKVETKQNISNERDSAKYSCENFSNPFSSMVTLQSILILALSKHTEPKLLLRIFLVTFT